MTQLNSLPLVLLVTACASGLHFSSSSSSGSTAAASDRGTGASVTGAPFDYDEQCIGADKAIDFHRDPVMRWDCFEGRSDAAGYTSTFSHLCTQINESLKGITCKMEHAGFDAHAAAQVQIPRNGDRDARNPDTYCSAMIGEFAGNVIGVENTLGMFARKPSGQAEFASKVQKIACVYDDAKGGSVMLADKTLTFFTSQRAYARGGWVFSSITATHAFPEFAKVVAEYGTCVGGRSC